VSWFGCGLFMPLLLHMAEHLRQPEPQPDNHFDGNQGDDNGD
jgi:hypothetical protein